MLRPVTTPASPRRPLWIFDTRYLKARTLAPETTKPDEHLLLVKHGNGDLFICDVADAALKDLIPQMEHRFYSLAKKWDTAIRRYEHNGNPFAHIKEDPRVFTTKPRAEKRVEQTAITQLAEQRNFPSRQAPKPPKVERRKPRIHRTGRNVQFNAKAKTISRVYKQADEMKITLGEWMERAVEALDRAGEHERV